MTETAHLLRLLSLVGHELRTPAGVIGGALRLIRMTGEGAPDRRDRALAQAERNYERVVEILGELSDLWRLEAGEAVFNRQALDLGRVLDQALALVTERSHEPLELRIRATPPLPIITGDPTRMARAFGALVLLVARHVRDGQAIVVHVPPGAGRVLVVVARADADLAAALASAREPLDEVEGGLGLAVPIARRVIEAEGGRVDQVGSNPRTVIVELAVRRASS